MPLTKPTVAQLNTLVTEISDPITLLNKGSTQANVDVGFVLNRDGGVSPNVAIYWNETTDSMAIAFTTSAGGVYANIALTSYANLLIGNLTSINATLSGNLSARVIPRIDTVADAATITPAANTSDQYNVTALNQAATIAIPTGAPADGQKLSIRLKDNGTDRALTWTTSAGGYRAIGATLPTTTTANKVTYVGCVYNAQDSFWDVVAVTTQA